MGFQMEFIEFQEAYFMGVSGKLQGISNQMMDSAGKLIDWSARADDQILSINQCMVV